MKSTVITVVIALGVLVLFMLIGNRQPSSNGALSELQQQKSESLQKRNEAMLKASGPRIALLVDDYLQAGGINFDFNATPKNVENVSAILKEIKERTERDAEYRVFISANNFVVKIRYIGTEDYLCTDMEVINQVVPQNSLGFDAKQDCSGKTL